MLEIGALGAIALTADRPESQAPQNIVLLRNLLPPEGLRPTTIVQRKG